MCPASLVEDHGIAIEFSDVEFSYPGQNYTLHIPVLRIREGEHLGIAGENGAGKSTLGKLMVRLYDPVHGRIRRGSEDIRNIRLESVGTSVTLPVSRRCLMERLHPTFAW
jgi:ATP-binding cassette subfamily B protein